MATCFTSIGAAAGFDPAKATKADLFRGTTLFAGLNCFEPGQSQRLHVHAGADKLYLIVSRKARITVGTESVVAEAGTIAWCPAGVPHGVEEALERTVMVIAMAPPPGA